MACRARIPASASSSTHTKASSQRINQVTEVIHEGRLQAYRRMVTEAEQRGGAGINGVGVGPDGAVVRFPALGAVSGDWGGG